MEVIERYIEKEKEEKSLGREELLKALKEDKFTTELICGKVYPELKNFEGKYPTYYRIDAAKACEYRTNAVIVFLKPELRSEKDFAGYLGEIYKDDLSFFLEDVKQGRIVPMMGKINEDDEDTYKPYTTGVYKELFELWAKDSELEEKYPCPLYANRLEELLTKGLKEWREEHKVFFEDKINAKEIIDFNIIDMYFRRDMKREGLPAANAIDYLSEKCGWFGLIGLDGVVEDIKNFVSRYNKGRGDKKYLYLAADYAFFIHQFATVPIFYSKGFANTISKADVLGAYETFKNVESTRSSASLYLCFLNSVYSSIKDAKDIIVPKLNTRKGKTQEERVELRRKTEKDENFQNEREEMIDANDDLFRKCKKGRNKVKDNIDETFGRVEEAIKNLSGTYDAEKYRKYDTASTGISYALTNLPFPLSLSDPLFRAMGIYDKLEEIGEEKINEYKILGEFTVPVYCWKEGENDPIPNKLRILFKH